VVQASPSDATPLEKGKAMKAINNVLDLVAYTVQSKDPLKKTISDCAAAVMQTAMSNARAVQRATGIAAVIRGGNGLWKSFARRLETIEDIGFNAKDFPDLEDMFVHELARLDPELFALCLEQKAFIGYKTTPADMERVKRAQQTLKTDKQPRLALRMAEALKPPERKKPGQR
jgi:hypothetical protein